MTNASSSAREMHEPYANGTPGVAELNVRSTIPAATLPERNASQRDERDGLPWGWSARAVHEMGDVLTGKALAVNAPGTQRPYLRTKNVLDGEIEIDDVLRMPMTDQQFDQFQVLPGDVLLNEGQSLDLVGRCSIYGGEYPEPCAMQNQLLRFRARRGTSADFASHLFRYAQQTGVFARVALQTTSIAHLGGSRFEKLVLAWPDIEREQTAIAEALSDVDCALRALDALIAKKRAIKQATMQQLLTGKIRLPGFAGKWTTKRLGEIAKIRMGRTPSRGNSSFWGQGHVWLSISDLQGKTVGESREQITDLAAASMRVIPKGTLLMSFKLSIGRLCFAACDLFSNEAICSFEEVKAEVEYLYYALSRTDFSLYGKQAVKGYTLNSQSLHVIEVPLPSLGEQKAIASALSDIDVEIAALQHRREKTQAIKQGMMQQLLTGRVRLVPPATATILDTKP
jgi:type I restriction enzyme, S subunit